LSAGALGGERASALTLPHATRSSEFLPSDVIFLFFRAQLFESPEILGENAAKVVKYSDFQRIGGSTHLLL